MAIEKDRLKELLSRLPEELQREVLSFAESLMRRGAGDGGTLNGRQSVRSFFGSWDSGNPQSADNALIDADLAREYANQNQAKS